MHTHTGRHTHTGTHRHTLHTRAVLLMGSRSTSRWSLSCLLGPYSLSHQTLSFLPPVRPRINVIGWIPFDVPKLKVKINYIMLSKRAQLKRAYRVYSSFVWCSEIRNLIYSDWNSSGGCQGGWRPMWEGRGSFLVWGKCAGPSVLHVSELIKLYPWDLGI